MKKKTKWRERKRQNSAKGKQRQGCTTPEKPVLAIQPEATSKPESPPKTWGKLSLLTWFGIITGIATLVALFLTVYPRIVVSPSSALNNHNPFSAPFFIENQGYLPIYEVEVLAHLPRVTGNIIMSNCVTQNRKDIFKAIMPGQKATAFIMFPENNSTQDAEAEIVVHYRPKFWFKRTQHFVFRLAKSKTGDIFWLPEQQRSAYQTSIRH